MSDITNDMVTRLTDILFDGSDLERSSAEDIVRELLAAMREPTEAMVAAGEGAQTLEVPDVWRTMIDKALGEVA